MKKLFLLPASAAICAALVIAGCYTQVGTERSETYRDEYPRNDQDNAEAYTDSSAAQPETEYYDDDGMPRYRYGFSYYYPTIAIGAGYYGPWYRNYWGYAYDPFYFDPFWCGTYYPGYYSGFYGGYYFTPRVHYGGFASYGGRNHGTTRTFGSTRTGGGDRGGGGYRSPATGSDNSLPAAMRRSSGSVTPKTSTGRTGVAPAHQVKRSGNARGGTTRSGGSKGTRVEPGRHPQHPSRDAAPPRESGGGNRGGVQSGGRSSAPPAQSTPPSSPPPSGGNTRSGGGRHR